MAHGDNTLADATPPGAPGPGGINLPTGPPVGEKTATWKIDELQPNTSGRAEAWKAILDDSGYSMQTSEVRSTVDEQGIRRAEFDMSYRSDQPDIAIIHAIVTNTTARAAAGHEKYAGVSIVEPEADRAARQLAAEAAAVQPHNRDRSMDVAAKPGIDTPAAEKEVARPVAAGSEKLVVIKVDEPAVAAGEQGQAEAVQAVLTASGAKAGALQSTVDAEGIRHSEMKVSYRTDQPEPVKYLWAVGVASVVGFIGNEVVAIFRIKVGKEIGSAALVADGYHARTDGIASLSVLLGVIGIWLGFPLADPIIGLIISFVIMKIVWRSGKDIFTRLLDGVDPAVGDAVRASALQVPGVRGVSNVRLRWLGHKLNAEVDVTVDDTLSVGQAHELGNQVVSQLRQDVQYLTTALVHTDPATAAAHQHA